MLRNGGPMLVRLCELVFSGDLFHVRLRLAIKLFCVLVGVQPPSCEFRLLLEQQHEGEVFDFDARIARSGSELETSKVREARAVPCVGRHRPRQLWYKLRLVIDPAALQIVLTGLTDWLDRREREAVAYLIEENRLLRRQLGGRRLRLTDDDRRRLAARAYRLGRAALREIATIATPDTLLRWHRQLIARKWTYARKSGPRRVLFEIRPLVVRMATENPTWGYTRIQGALQNVGHHVGRSTIRRILKAAGLPPVPPRPTSWQTFLRAHWGAIAGADFFTTEVWTWRGVVTYYTVFVIDLASRRVLILG